MTYTNSRTVTNTVPRTSTAARIYLWDNGDGYTAEIEDLKTGRVVMRRHGRTQSAALESAHDAALDNSYTVTEIWCD